MHILGIILIGFVAGIIARLLAPGANNPAGFILTTLLGIAGAFVASLIEQALGLYGPNHRVGLLGAVVGSSFSSSGTGWWPRARSRTRDGAAGYEARRGRRA